MTDPRVVLVTGCSSGIGLETALELAQRGWRVFASVRDLSNCEVLQQRVATAGTLAGELHIVQMDVREVDSVKWCVRSMLRMTQGRLDALVANAGIASSGAFEDTSDVEFARIFDTNFYGVTRVTREVLPAFRRRRRGTLLLVTSDSALYGLPTLSAYTASKWAVEGWAESLAYEVRPFNIDICCIEPGACDTGIWTSAPTIMEEDSPYFALTSHMQVLAEKKIRPAAIAPAKVAKVIADQLDKSPPKFRRPVGPDATAMWAARGLVPRWLLTRLLRSYLELEKASTTSAGHRTRHLELPVQPPSDMPDRAESDG